MKQECICDKPLNKIWNTHSNNRNINMILMSDSDGYGIIVFENHTAIACFEIDYCPKCGKNLTT